MAAKLEILTLGLICDEFPPSFSACTISPKPLWLSLTLTFICRLFLDDYLLITGKFRLELLPALKDRLAMLDLFVGLGV